MTLQMTEHLQPFVSVIMPTRNEALFIKRSLESILSQTYPHDRIEIIVADGISNDGTREIIQDVAASSKIPIYLVDNTKLIAPAALNRAIERAAGSVIIRVDGHCEIDPEYVRNCVELLASGAAAGVGGPIETIGQGIKSEAIALAMSSKFGVGGSAFRTVTEREMFTDTVAFPAYTREIIERAGPFDEELVRNQDDEYNYRIREMGGKILLSPKIRSRYYSRSTFRSLWRQYFQYGYWKVRVLQLHPRQMRLRQFVPFVFVLSILALSSSSIIFAPVRWVFAETLCIYLFVGLAASFVSVRTKIRLAPYLLISFCILHVAYGLGFMTGLAAFRGRWRGAFTPIGVDAPNVRARQPKG